MKKISTMIALLVLVFSSFFSSITPLVNASSGNSSIEVSPLNEDGTVKGSPVVTAVVADSSLVEKVTFYAKALNEPEESFYGYTPDFQAPYSWSWPTGDPWVPDGDYTLKMVINYHNGEEEIVLRDITVKNYTEPNAPAEPTQLLASERTNSSLTLSWTPSTSTRTHDYVVYQNGTPIAETAATSLQIQQLNADELYQFRVKTRDIYNNDSLGDNSITVRIPVDSNDVDALPTISTIQASGSKGVTPGSEGFSGDVGLSVTATDDEEITKVEFFVKVLGAPENDYWKFPTTRKNGDTYSVNWVTTSSPDGEVIIKALAYDSNGQSSTTTNIFLVDNEVDGGTHAPIWEPAETPPANRVVAYLAGWSTYGSYRINRDLDASRITHINYAFALIGSDLKVKMGDVVQDPVNFNELRILKDNFPHLKTIIAIGGWGGSENFIEAAATEESREIFAESAVDFMLEHGFDGVDLDWEYPVTGGGPGTYPNPADRDNYPLLLETLRAKLNEQGEKDGKHYLLTIAGGATTGFANNTQLGLSQQYLDYVQIMTYDIHGTWETLADHNAPLFDDNGKTYSVEQGVQAYLNAGVPKDKLVMGVPFYGYRYNVSSSEDYGLRQPFNSGGSITYNRFVRDNLLENGYERFWDEGSKVPYLFNAEENIFISYDDEESMRYKAEFIRDNELGGAMIWEISQDHGNDLLATLYDVLKDPFEDTTPPTTSVEITGEQWQAGTLLHQAVVTLKAEDNRSGISKTEYKINDGEWITYTAPIIIETNGTTLLHYRSIDKAGNVELVQTLEIKIVVLSYNNLYTLIHESNIHHGQQKALVAQIRQAERASTREKEIEKLEKAERFLANMSSKHIDDTDREEILLFMEKLIR